MQEVLGKIGFDWHLAIVNLVNVFIIFLVLKKWAFGPIQNIIDERKKEVDASLQSAQDAQKQSEMAEQEREKTIAKARKEAQGILETANEESKGIVEEGKLKLSKEKDEMLKKASLEIEAKKKESEDKLKSQASVLITSGIKKILKEEVDREMNSRIINKS
ncbi:MAG: F0F1 ATP synthase subunit B [bacterium]|nr:F0F1 ATP synthase subunit B [bacterium]